MRKLFFILITLLWSSASLANDDISRVQFLDYSPSTGNYLFRGDMPDDQTKCPYQFEHFTLRKRLHDAKLQHAPKLPNNYYLVDISLLDPALNPNDAKDNMAEAKYFIENPQHGKFISWPLLGSYVPPVSVSTGVCIPNSKAQWIRHTCTPTTKTIDVPNTPLFAQGKFSSPFSYDALDKRAVLLHKMMNTPHDIPYVFYIHCHSGCDRTGMMATAYKIINAESLPQLRNILRAYWPIQNGHKSRINTENDKQQYDPGCGRNPNYWATSQILWLCYYKVGELYNFQDWAEHADIINASYKTSCLDPINIVYSSSMADLQKLPTDNMDKYATGLPLPTQA